MRRCFLRTRNARHTPGTGAKQFEVGQPDPASPRFRTLRAVHERYRAQPGDCLVGISALGISGRASRISRSRPAGAFRPRLPNPTCLMVFQLHPRDERMYLHMNCATVFGLLELLLGGKCGPEPVAPRNLTEIEWSLLEEIVRVMVRPLGEAWQTLRDCRVRSGIAGQRAGLGGPERSEPASESARDPPGLRSAMRRTLRRAGDRGAAVVLRRRRNPSGTESVRRICRSPTRARN